MRLLIATILLTIGVCASAQTIPSSEQVEELLRQGKTVEATLAIQQVLAVKPNSIKANYYMAQLVQMEKGDASPYRDKYQPYLNKIAVEKAKAEEAEKLKQAEKTKGFFKFFGYLVLVLFVVTMSAIFIPDVISKYKEKKRNEDKQKLRLEYEENKRIELLKQTMSINDELLANLYDQEEKAKEHRNFALDAIEILSKKGDYDLPLIEKWINDVKFFMIMYRSVGA